MSATACGGPRGDVLGQLLHVDPVWQHLKISGIVNIVCVSSMTAKGQKKQDVQAPVGVAGICIIRETYTLHLYHTCIYPMHACMLP